MHACHIDCMVKARCKQPLVARQAIAVGAGWIAVPSRVETQTSRHTTRQPDNQTARQPDSQTATKHACTDAHTKINSIRYVVATVVGWPGQSDKWRTHVSRWSRTMFEVAGRSSAKCASSIQESQGAREEGRGGEEGREGRRHRQTDKQRPAK